MIRALKTILLCLGIFCVARYGWLTVTRPTADHSKPQQLHPATQYYCPMHPSVTSDRPGKCPICGMDLQPHEAEDPPVEPEHTHTTSHKVLFYRDPMGKGITSPVPMKDEMGMDFIPVYEDEAASGDETVESVGGRAAVSLSESSQQLIGVKKTTARKDTVNYEIKSAGRVAFDPSLYAAILEYRIALAAAKQTRAAAGAVAGNSDALVAAARLKFELMGLSKEQIKSFEDSSFDANTLLLPQSTVWVYADVYEYELPHLKSGQQVVVETGLFPTAQFIGKVVSISPLVNPASRTVSIRAEVADPSHQLKPDMFLTVRIQLPLGEQLVVPDDAVIHTGDMDLVFRFDDTGRFVPTPVKIGVKTRGLAVVLSGLQEGDTVASGANFLIDSESRLKAVIHDAQSAQQAHKE